MRKYLFLMVVLAAIEISLATYLTSWREVFWQSVSTKNSEVFITQLAIFTGVAIAFCMVSAWTGYVSNLAAIKWREKLNARYSKFANHEHIENVNQRIQQDCADYPTLMLNIGFNGVKSLVYIGVFSALLVYHFSAMWLLYITIYAILGTWVAKRIAKPLIAINYKSQQVEATYRNGLSEMNFRTCIATSLQLAIKTKHLQYFQTLYSQVSVIIPIVIVAPAYFFSGLTLGQLMQATGIMSTLVDNLSYGVVSFDNINRLLSCKRRLGEVV